MFFFIDLATMIIRTARNEDEIELAIQNYWINEPPGASSHAGADLAHWFGLFADWPDDFFIAIDDTSQQIIGVASAALHPPQWTLTNFFVHPDYHGQGIGRALFSQALAWHEGCTRFAVHASQHPSAQRLYLGAGMYPQPYSIVFKGTSTLSTPLASKLSLKPCSVLDALDIINPLEQNAFGFTREIDHRWWAKSGNYFLVTLADSPIGYFRISVEGIVGPLVVADARWTAEALELAIREMVSRSINEHTVFVPGANTAAIAYLVENGYRYTELELLLSSHPMPGLANVIFHDTDRL